MVDSNVFSPLFPQASVNVVYLDQLGGAGDWNYGTETGTDNLAAFARARAKLAGPGIIKLGRGRYMTSQVLPPIQEEGIFIEGEGGVYCDTDMDRARAASPTVLVLHPSATPGKIIQWTPPATTVLRGGGLKNLLIDGSGVATYGVEYLSWMGLQFEGVHVIDCSEYGWSHGVIGENAMSCSYIANRDCSYVDTGTSKGLVTWGYGQASPLERSNACFSVYDNFRAKTGNTVHIDIEDSDSLTFLGGTGHMVLHGTGTGSKSFGDDVLAARHNVFVHHVGKVTAKASVGGGTVNMSSLANLWVGHNRDNSIPLPTIETGADLSVTLLGGNFSGKTGAITYGYGVAGVRLVLASGQAIGTGSTTAVSFPAPSTDIFTAWSSGNPTRITIPAGVKMARITGSFSWESNSTGFRYADIYKNGTTEVVKDARPAANGIETSSSVTTGWMPVSAGDYFELRGRQNSGGNLNALAFSTYFDAEFK